MALPRAIYFETSTLWGAGHRKDDPSLQTLVGYSEIVETPPFTTRLVRDELAEKHRTELKASKAALEAACSDLARRRVPVPTVNWPTPYEQLMDELPGKLEENLGAYGIAILPNLQVDQERLVSMAVRKEPPFMEKGEKGFRDTIIVLTVLDHARANGWNSLMLVTNDDAVIQATKSLPEAQGLEVQIARNIEEAGRNIDKFIGEVVRRWEQMRKAACRDAVLRDRQRVEEFIRQRGEFPDTMFFNSLMPGEQVVDAVNASLTDVEVVAVGKLPVDSPEGRVQVSLDAKIEVQAKVTLAFWPAIRRFKLGRGGPEQDSVASAIMRRTREAADRAIPVEVRLEGSVHVRRHEGREEFSDVQLDAFNPPGSLLSTLFLLGGLAGTPPAADTP